MWLIVSAAFVPLILFVIFQVGFTAQAQRGATESQVSAVAEQLIVAANGEVGRIGTVLQVLATAQSTKKADWQRLASRFAELATFNADIRGLEVRSRTGSQILLSAGIKPDGITRTADGATSSKPLFVGYARGGGCLCLIFELSTTDSAGNAYVFTLLTDSTVFLKLLPPSGELFEVSAFNGPDGRFIARTLDDDGRFGTAGSIYLRQAVFSGKMAGTYRGVTLEGFENYTAFTRSRRTGWTAHVALSSNYIDTPTRKFIASLAAAGFLSLALAGLLISSAVRQINAARRMTERLQQTQKMEALGQLTGGIAHDFNNLLTPIVGALDMLHRRESLDERGRKLAAGALASAERAGKLTGQLLTFSRRQQLQIEPINVAALAKDVTALVERAFASDHLFELSIDPRVQGVTSDANQLELALLNLALNARDASPPGATVRLAIEAVGGDSDSNPPDVLFAMRDEGTGMDEETRRRALEPFFTTKPVGRGTGLGLAQVLGVAEQSGGSVTIDSELGKGATVSMRLPGCPTPHLDPAKTKLADQPTENFPLKLLVVDDDPAVRATTARMLEAAGHSVDSVSRGTTALAALTAEPFDLVIVDFAMPGMNGAELLRQAHRVCAGLRALVISGFSDTQALAASGVAAPILPKPFSSEQLLNAVNKAVGR